MSTTDKNGLDPRVTAAMKAALDTIAPPSGFVGEREIQARQAALRAMVTLAHELTGRKLIATDVVPASQLPVLASAAVSAALAAAAAVTRPASPSSPSFPSLPPYEDDGHDQVAGPGIGGC